MLSSGHVLANEIKNSQQLWLFAQNLPNQSNPGRDDVYDLQALAHTEEIFRVDIWRRRIILIEDVAGNWFPVDGPTPMHT